MANQVDPISFRKLVAFYKAFAPEKTDQDAQKIVLSGISLKDLNVKLTEKYGCDLNCVSPLSPQHHDDVARSRFPSDLSILSISSSHSSLSAAKAMDKNLVILRKGELMDYYAFHNPDRPNLEEHVDHLFETYSFDKIKEALLKKYGVAPSGW